MTKKNVSVFALIVLLALPVCIAAQNSTSSPYSLFGVGILTPKEDAASAGMGHTGVALAPNEWVNIANPAGINGLDSLTFYFNMQLKGFYANESTMSERQSVYSLNLDGLSFAFRNTKWWATALGYSPYSSVGYNMIERKWIVGANIKYVNNYTGSGGLQQAYFNNAFTFFRHFTVGVSVSALWGAINKTETARFKEAIGGEDIYNTKKYTMNNWFFEYGFQYDFNIGKNNIRLGGVFNEKTHLESTYDHIVSNDISSELFFDDVTPLKEDFYVPRSYAGGIAFKRGKLTATADFKLSEWSNVVNSKFGETVKYTDSWTVGGGFEYRAGQQGMPFYKRMRYRAGYSFTKDYMKMRGVNLDNYSITLGLTVPMGKWNNAVTIAYEYLNRGTEFNGMVKEKFQNLKVALNIRETWFMKAKFD